MTPVYLLFHHANYYPYGGVADCYGVFATLEDAVAALRKRKRHADRAQILQVPDMIVREYHIDRNDDSLTLTTTATLQEFADLK
jgi:hypothetical protein